jgi:hypothetical protein
VGIPRPDLYGIFPTRPIICSFSYLLNKNPTRPMWNFPDPTNLSIFKSFKQKSDPTSILSIFLSLKQKPDPINSLPFFIFETKTRPDHFFAIFLSINKNPT